MQFPLDLDLSESGYKGIRKYIDCGSCAVVATGLRSRTYEVSCWNSCWNPRSRRERFLPDLEYIFTVKCIPDVYSKLNNKNPGIFIIKQPYFTYILTRKYLPSPIQGPRTGIYQEICENTNIVN